MMPTFLLLIAVISAVLDWIAVLKEFKTLEYIAKPAVMLALLAWLWSVSRFQGSLFWFALGLFFSLLGDIFLMLPRDRFIPGLVSFLLAHIAYVIGFTRTLPPVNLGSLLFALAVTAAAGSVYRRIASALAASGDARLKTPIFIYTNVISLMLLTALLTLLSPEWSTLTALAASLGALLFFISDGILAWNKFVAPLRYGKLAVIVSYHLGQILITVGAAQHFLQS